MVYNNVITGGLSRLVNRVCVCVCNLIKTK